MTPDQPTATATPRTASERLCCIAQLIQGWKGTTPANEWSEFDEQCLCDCAILERELAEAKAEVARLNEWLTYWQKLEAQMEVERDQLRAEVAELEQDKARLIEAGDRVAAMFDPGPIPANEPTEADWTVADWETAKAARNHDVRISTPPGTGHNIIPSCKSEGSSDAAKGAK